MKIKSVRVLTVTHLAFYFLIALYLGVFHPGCGWFVSLLFLAGLFVEFPPRWFNPGSLPGMFLAAMLAGSWGIGLFAQNTATFHGAAGMVLAYWLLIPSRLGRLKWVLALVLVELVLMATLPSNGFSLMCALPLGIAALGFDRWLLDSVPVGLPANRRRIFPFLRWVIAPVILVASVTLITGSWAVTKTAEFHARHQAAKEPGAASGPLVTGFDGNLAIGNHRSISRDARVAASLTWETGAPPDDMIYLRALALPDLVVTQGVMSWEPIHNAPLRAVSKPARQPERWAQLYRMPSRTDVVLRVDGGEPPELPGMLADEDGNLYRQNLRAASENYRVDFDDRRLEADASTLTRCRVVNPLLETLPWDQIEDPLWSRVHPEYAALLICEWLETRCRYDIENLPRPAPGAAGVLRGFLFGRTLAERTGHCQYFTTAAVLLLRRAGHTARCVSGYASDEMDGRSVVFRSLHAHAWLEVVNSRGCWQRFDPTPSLRNTRIIDGVDLKSVSPASEETSVPSQEETSTQSASVRPERIAGWLIPLLALVFLAVFRAVSARLSGAQSIQDPRMAELGRRNHDLIQVAIALGIPVTSATTLSALVTALERVTGISLQPHLNAHLAARFGQGPLPEPWPLAAMLQENRERLPG
ncbi:MAG: hypothetical protein JWL90_1298 [Chthoniobacteraceae bacterium]|nr:hypothetical protein [Chthoniobacteraceae bacterium]